MTGGLTPICEGIPPAAQEQRGGAEYAILDRDALVALARALPDAQSAVLLCLAWQAAVQERMKRGEHAGLPVARISAGTLAECTGRTRRTVWAAIGKLRTAGLVDVQRVGSRVNVYRLRLKPLEADSATPSG